MNERLTGRNGEVWRAWVSGISQVEIADTYGISQQRVSQILRDIKDSIEPDDLALLRLREADMVAVVRVEMLAMVRDADLDPSDRVAAGRLVVQTSERVAKLFGLDAALRADVNVTGTEEQAAREAAAASAAFLHGGEAAPDAT